AITERSLLLSFLIAIVLLCRTFPKKQVHILLQCDTAPSFSLFPSRLRTFVSNFDRLFLYALRPDRFHPCLHTASNTAGWRRLSDRDYRSRLHDTSGKYTHRQSASVVNYPSRHQQFPIFLHVLHARLFPLLPSVSLYPPA